MSNMACLLYYMVINNIKQEIFTFKCGINRGIHLSPSEVIMQNSVVQVLLTRIRLIKECLICSFMPYH